MAVAPAPTITAGQFAAVKRQADNTNLIRKTLELMAFIGPTSIAAPSTLVAADSTITIPAGFYPVGTVDPKGIVIDGKMEKDTVDSLGYSTPTRTDITGFAKTLKLTVQERYKAYLEGVIQLQTLNTIVPATTTGEVVWDEVSIPLTSEYRLLVIARDINKATGGDIIDARFYTRAAISDASSESFAEKGARDVELTFDLLVDSTLGTSCRHILGGKGFKDLTPVLGYAS